MTPPIGSTRAGDVDILDYEEVILDDLTTEELLKERAEVKLDISRIATQLQTQPGRPTTPEDESPEWVAFRDWRRRARWALDFKRQEMESIKQLLRERDDTSQAARALRIAQNQPTEFDLIQQERGRKLREAMAGESDLTLLLGTYRVIRHLLKDGEELPPTITADDRDVLSKISIRLRNEYGTGNLRAFVMGEVTP